jgi:hypothetical protein
MASLTSKNQALYQKNFPHLWARQVYQDEVGIYGIDPIELIAGS